jgi:hypothetical protein
MTTRPSGLGIDEAGGGMDLLEAKSRIAEALVASVFRRARYRIDPFPARHLPLRIGREDFSPDFVATLDDGVVAAECQIHVEVKYRPSVEQFISVENQRGDRSVFLLMRRHWPSLYFVLVTDRPQAGRSCFQALSFAALKPGEPFGTVDLDHLEELRIFRNNVEDHEELVRRIMSLLAAV